MPQLTDLLSSTYRGYTGSKGDPGIQGVQGVYGIQGAPGPQGPTVYDFGVVSIETPLGGSVLGKVIFPRSFNIPDDFAGSRGHVDTNPTTDPYVIAATKNGVEIGTISISTSGIFTFATSNTEVEIIAGDIIRFIAPDPAQAESTISGISITIAGTI